MLFRLIEFAIVTNCRLKRICKNLHTLDIGVEPVFHKVFEVIFIRFNTGVFDINDVQAKVACHLSEILIELSRLVNTRSEGKQCHYKDLRVGISLLHLMEGDSICLHGVFRLFISISAVIVFGNQRIKIYSLIASKH